MGLISLATVVFGAVMLAQWACDPENAALPFRLLGLTLLALGLYGVLWLYVLEKRRPKDGKVYDYE